jgi:nickel/cobalt transporter (NicO) family protein
VTAVLWLGLLLGLRHALEADHLSAVAALASSSGRIGATLRVAGAWGCGHAFVLAAAGTIMVLAGAALPAPAARACELVAAVALIVIGVGTLRRAAGHRRASSSPAAAPPPFASRALVIGSLHGLEGSGAVVLVALPTVRSPLEAFAYLGLFGLGSIAGMLACSVAIALPLEAARRRSHAAIRAVEWLAGATSVVVGTIAALQVL